MATKIITSTDAINLAGTPQDDLLVANGGLLLNPPGQLPLSVVIYGGGGDDTLVFSTDYHVISHLIGGNGDDLLIGQGYYDTLSGNKGRDTLIAKDVSCIMYGGMNADVFVANPHGHVFIGDFHQIQGDRIALPHGAVHYNAGNGALSVNGHVLVDLTPGLHLTSHDVLFI